jgi:hypothetical protein
MRARYFILGVLAGVVASAVVLAAVIAMWVSRPVPELPQAASPPTGDVTVLIQESYLGRVATELAREQEPMIQTVVVDVQPGARVDMTLGLQVTVLGQTLDLQARLINAVRVEDARLRFDLQKIEFAGLDIPLDLLPQSLRTTLETTVADANDQANRMLADTGLLPLGVTTDDSSIAVSLRAR